MGRRNQSIRKVTRCHGTTKAREQCRKRTARTKKCWIHLQNENNLRIKKSNIANAGFGLFAGKKRIKRNAKISTYSGRKSTKKGLDRKYGNNLSQYGICQGKYCIDANHTTDNAARYANDHYGTNLSQNSSLRKGKNGPAHFYLRADRIIRPHEEIITDYGDEYWE